MRLDAAMSRRADAHVADINTVNKPESDNDNPSILEPIEVATSAAESNGTHYSFGEVRVATSAEVHRRYLQIFRCLVPSNLAFDLANHQELTGARQRFWPYIA